MIPHSRINRRSDILLYATKFNPRKNVIRNSQSILNCRRNVRSFISIASKGLLGWNEIKAVDIKVKNKNVGMNTGTILSTRPDGGSRMCVILPNATAKMKHAKF